MQIFVNNEPNQINAINLQAWMEEKGLSDKKGLAIAVNDEVVPRNAWRETDLQEGDRILLIQATQGG